MDLSLDKPIIENAQLGRRICRCFITDKRTPIQENMIIELVLKLRADHLVIVAPSNPIWELINPKSSTIPTCRIEPLNTPHSDAVEQVACLCVRSNLILRWQNAHVLYICFVFHIWSILHWYIDWSIYGRDNCLANELIGILFHGHCWFPRAGQINDRSYGAK